MNCVKKPFLCLKDLGSLRHFHRGTKRFNNTKVVLLKYFLWEHQLQGQRSFLFVPVSHDLCPVREPNFGWMCTLNVSYNVAIMFGEMKKHKPQICLNLQTMPKNL